MSYNHVTICVLPTHRHLRACSSFTFGFDVENEKLCVVSMAYKLSGNLGGEFGSCLKCPPIHCWSMINEVRGAVWFSTMHVVKFELLF
jgi:hypothetical protein